MKDLDNPIRADFEFDFCMKAQPLIRQRAQKFTQSQMAGKLGVSLRTIQNFEKYRTTDAYLIYGYRKVLRGTQS